MAGRVERYSAFLSYSHHDAPFARRLHRRLEAYRLPRRLLRARPGLPRRLKPVFCDCMELAAASNLPEAVQKAIAESSHLIVVATPASVASAWVVKEVALFRAIHTGGVLAVLEDGAGSETLAALGLVSADGAEPLAADFSKSGDGEHLAFLKLVAALVEVGLDELIQRDAQRRVRRLTIVACAALAGMAAMGTLALIAVYARQATEREQSRSAVLVDYLLKDMRERIKARGGLDLLDALDKGALRYFQSEDPRDLPVRTVMNRAQLLDDIGEDNERRGRMGEARTSFEEALRITTTLLREMPEDPQRIFQQAQSEYWLGKLVWESHDYAEARQRFDAYAALAGELLRIEPGKPEWILEQGYASTNLGVFLLRVDGNTARSEPLFKTAIVGQQRMLILRPNDFELMLDEADSYGWLGDVAHLRYRYGAAIESRRKALSVVEAVLAVDPNNHEALWEKIAHEVAIGRAVLDGGDPAQALDMFRRCEAEVRAYAALDPAEVGVPEETRMIKLLEAKSLLFSHGSIANAAISEMLGDCKDSGTPHADEIRTFCRILRAGLPEASDIPPGDRLAAKPNPPLLQNVERLSSRWGLDYAEELREIDRLRSSRNLKR